MFKRKPKKTLKNMRTAQEIRADILSLSQLRDRGVIPYEEAIERSLALSAEAKALEKAWKKEMRKQK